MERLIHKNRYGTDVYEVVDEYPLGYMIWNIGANAPEGYLPLCRPSHYQQPFSGSRNIDTNTLKAIKVEGAQDILAAIGYGQVSLAEMVQYVKRYKGSKDDLVQDRVARYRKAIPIMRKIKGIEHLRTSF